MKAFLLRRASVLAVPAVTCAWTHLAMAQGAPPPGAVPPAPGATPAAPPAIGPTAAPPAPAPSSAPAATPAAAATPKWYDAAKVEGFVDAYSSWNFNFPKPQVGTNNGRAFDVANGFALHWAGVNASYAPDPTKGSPVGGFVGLRFGPGAPIYNAGTDAAAGAVFVKEAYVSWKPDPKFQIDIGKFSTWIGAEVADSQYNMNYTRSALFATQSVHHTGIRIDLPLADQFDLKLFVVNGWNNVIDNNAGKTIGASANIIANKDMLFYVNYIGGPEQNDFSAGNPTATPPVLPGFDSDAGGRWRHLVDFIADLHFDKAHVLVNADFGTEKMNAAGTKNTWYGANATLGYAMTDMFSLALRGGYTADSDGAYVSGLWLGTGKAKVIDATLTLAAMPTPNLIIKLEPRIDSFDSDSPGYSGLYPKGSGDPLSKTLFTTTLGVVATTN
jgi:Putative beta-barrel porin-2, OmpL-like. bbp2